MDTSPERSSRWKRLSPSSLSPNIFRPSLEVKVGAFDIREDWITGHAFVVYEIACDELGQSWVLNRRWNDLKRAMEDLQRSDGARLNGMRERIPRFEPHAFRFDPLETAFLQQRCVAAEGLLQALVRELDVSVVRGTGPAALRELLDRGGQPGEAQTPSPRSGSGPRGWGDLRAGKSTKRASRIARLEPLLDAAIEPGEADATPMPQARRSHTPHHVSAVIPPQQTRERHPRHVRSQVETDVAPVTLHRASGRTTFQATSVSAIYEEEPEEREAQTPPATKPRSTKLAMANEASFNIGALPPVSPRKWSFQRPSWPRLHVPAAYELDALPPVSPQKWSFQRQKWSFQRPKPEVRAIPPVLLKTPVDHSLGSSRSAPLQATWCLSSAVWILSVLVAACAIAAISRGDSWSWIDWGLDWWSQWLESDSESVSFVPAPERG